MLNITVYTFKRFKYLIFITHFELKWNWTSEINCAWNSDETSTFFACKTCSIYCISNGAKEMWTMRR